MDKELIISCILRMLLALVLGFAIGFERKMRYKEAGIRTHTIVCVGSCLYTIVSIFGFGSGDPGRVAAQIVSGIGFIGAGMIFNHKQVVHGLTTAAGIWATAAIGMAVGAFIGVLAYAMAGISPSNPEGSMTIEGLNKLWMMLVLSGAVSFIACIIPMLFYTISEDKQRKMVAEIAAGTNPGASLKKREQAVEVEA